MMTRYTNVGRKRTYLQASFDPGDDQIASNVASTSSLRSPDTTRTLHENSVDVPIEPSRKRPRKSNANSKEEAAAESGPTTVTGDGNKESPQVIKSERTKKALAKLKAKEKAKRVKSAYFLPPVWNKSITTNSEMAMMLTTSHTYRRRP
jgi:hypothetical protein